MTDLYAVLGVKRDATSAAIKAAYRKKAKKAHPDQGGDTKAFYLLHRAYKVLTHAERRGRYDQDGEIDELKATNSPDLSALEHINLMLVTVLGSDEDVMTWDLTSRLSDQCGIEIKALKTKIASLRRAKDRAEKMRTRILRRTEGEENKLAKMFDWHANHTQEMILKLEQAILTRQRAVEILKDYEFKADKVMPQRVYFSQQAGATTTASYGFGG